MVAGGLPAASPAGRFPRGKSTSSKRRDSGNRRCRNPCRIAVTGLYKQLTEHLNSAAILGGAKSAIPMSRQFVIVLRILAVGSALTILACQIVNRQKQAGAATGD